MSLFESSATREPQRYQKVRRFRARKRFRPVCFSFQIIPCGTNELGILSPNKRIGVNGTAEPRVGGKLILKKRNEYHVD